MHIGEKIKAKRLELGMSQRELARKMGYSDNSTLNRIEKGTVDVTQSKVVQFSKALNCSIAYLMDWEENTPTEIKLDEGEKMLLDLFRLVPDDKKQTVLELVRLALKTQE